MKSLRREYPLSTLLELIGMPRSTYYYHEANPPSDRQATERPAIVEICEKSQQWRYTLRAAGTISGSLIVLTLRSRPDRSRSRFQILSEDAALSWL